MGEDLFVFYLLARVASDLGLHCLQYVQKTYKLIPEEVAAELQSLSLV